MGTESTLAETPEQFLVALGDNLKKEDGVDLLLADVLREHILKAVPTLNAVANAKDAIVKIAAERASVSEPEVADA